MIKSKSLFYTRYLVLMICSLLIVSGCAAPEMEEMDTVLSQTEVAPSVVKVSNVSTESLVGKMRITIEADSELTYTVDTNCSVDGSCPNIAYDSELAYINNCSVDNSCPGITYDSEASSLNVNSSNFRDTLNS